MLLGVKIALKGLQTVPCVELIEQWIWERYIIPHATMVSLGDILGFSITFNQICELEHKSVLLKEYEGDKVNRIIVISSKSWVVLITIVPSTDMQSIVMLNIQIVYIVLFLSLNGLSTLFCTSFGFCGTDLCLLWLFLCL